MSQSKKMYIYDLPYEARKQLCLVLDVNDEWENLGGLMKYNVLILNSFKQAVKRNASPTDELLNKWSSENHYVLELFYLLSKMKHYYAMSIIKDCVDPRYHHLIELGGVSSLVENGDEANGGAKSTIRKDHYGDNLDTSLRKNAGGSRDGVKLMNDCGKASSDDIDCPLEGTRKISYFELQAATENWSESCMLGRGGFGMVYRGNWKQTLVAIKRLKKLGKGLSKSLLAELRTLNTVKHDNVLPLYGFSCDGEYGCLVYQYMQGGSLEDRLQMRGIGASMPPLSWVERKNIAVGTARGLQFLHTSGGKPLVHGDIKSANILLDSKLEPKIGDFGLARQGPDKNATSVKVSQVNGTRPYLPDELLRSGKLSTKVDTYSFGIVLMELATGRRAMDINNRRLLKDVVMSVTSDAELDGLKDVKAPGDYTPTFGLLIVMGKLCCAQVPRERPDMVQVFRKLESAADQTRQCVSQTTSPEFMNRYISPGSQLPVLQIPQPSTPAVFGQYPQSYGQGAQPHLMIPGFGLPHQSPSTILASNVPHQIQHLSPEGNPIAVGLHLQRNIILSPSPTHHRPSVPLTTPSPSAPPPFNELAIPEKITNDSRQEVSDSDSISDSSSLTSVTPKSISTDSQPAEPMPQTTLSDSPAPPVADMADLSIDDPTYGLPLIPVLYGGNSFNSQEFNNQPSSLSAS